MNASTPINDREQVCRGVSGVPQGCAARESALDTTTYLVARQLFFRLPYHREQTLRFIRGLCRLRSNTSAVNRHRLIFDE